MKNRILSFALVLIMLVTSVVTVFPMSVSAEAASSGITVNVTPSNPEITSQSVVQNYINEDKKSEYTYSTAQDMLEYDKENGYLDSVSAGDYVLYVNKYSGIVYYQNTVTGQILTSNPYDQSHSDANKADDVFSQIEISYQSLSDPSGSALKYYSATWLLDGYNLEVEAITNGIRVKYTLGTKVDELYAPAVMLAEDFEEQIVFPLLKQYAEIIEKYFGTAPDEPIRIKDAITKEYYEYDSFDLSLCEDSMIRRNGCIEKDKITDWITAFNKYFQDKIGRTYTNDSRYKEITAFSNQMSTIITNYLPRPMSYYKDENGNFKSAQTQAEFEKIPALAESDNAAVYIIKDDENADLVSYKNVDKAIKKTLGNSFSLTDMASAVDKTGYVSKIESSPWFECAIEYTLDSDGILSVNVPVNLIDYDKQRYNITAITPIKYFGSGNLFYSGDKSDGYAFIPDGSGAIVEFKDITEINASISSKVYGQDACYSYIGTTKPNEQVTMPVYGMVTEEVANADTKELGIDGVTNGFFAVIESGATMSSIALTSDKNIDKACTYSSFSPYPSDRYDLSQTLSVGSTSYYNMVAKTAYTGNCKIVITMLTDDNVAQALEQTSYYPSTYVGMAACYKDYLKDKGVIDDIVETSEDIPLYIEALGSIDVVEKILTFPVTVSTPLTSFEDIEEMYSDFTNAAATLKIKALSERIAAAKLDDGESDGDIEEQKKAHYEKAEEYERLAEEVESITNINFKLTGFANGGMYFTYPAKLVWENSVGGEKGFETLVSQAKSYSSKANYNFGIYPDFDFLYINNTELFDGVSINSTAARYVDNRYASRQEWKALVSITGVFETTYAMLVTPDEMMKHYDKFNETYSKYGNKALSVSTLGSDINSNFDEKNLHNREDSLTYIKNLLNKMANTNQYSVMVDVGNIYTAQYASHILNATVDSSHLKNASYTIPFYGLVLHGYVNYAGTPINYSGTPDYDILRAIENGSSLYYVLCCQNTNRLKEDANLSSYYGIDYNNWFERILVQYKTLNDAIGDLQTYEITGHSKIYAERIIDSDETRDNNIRLVNEFVNENVDNKLRDKLDKALAAIRETYNPAAVAPLGGSEVADYIGQSVYIYVDYDSLKTGIKTEANLTDEELEEYGFSAMLDAVAEKYRSEGYEVVYGTTDEDALNYINFTDADLLDENGKYITKYSYVTDSNAMDDDYVYTDFTCDNGNVMMVKYSDPDSDDFEVFVLNYNTFSVEVSVDETLYKCDALKDGKSVKITIPGLGFVKLSDVIN